MGLDIYLYHFKGAPGVSPSLPRLWGEAMRSAWKSIGDGRAAHTFSEAEKKQYSAACREIKKGVPDEYRLFFDESVCEEVKAPSAIHGSIDNEVGYMQVSYADGWGTAHNKALRALYEAFDEVAHPTFAIVVPEWERTSQALQQQIARLQETQEVDEIDHLKLRLVLQAVDWVLAQPERDSYFLLWST